MMGNISTVRMYKRSSTNTTVSLFYEQHRLGKYNYEPPYQRDYNVWETKEKSFLMDTIFKNFPMPAIFLEQIIENRQTMFDVIDGKQRLNAIVDFIDDKFRLPDAFGSDDFGYQPMSGLLMSQIEKLSRTDENVAKYLDVFWSYIINVEYIEGASTGNTKIVDNIFDRLNRGGKRLNPAELRKAQYYDTAIYQGIVHVANAENFTIFRDLIGVKRQEHIQFITEIYLLAYMKEVESGESDKVDELFKRFAKQITLDISATVEQDLMCAIDILIELDLNYVEYSIAGTSHLYALFYLALYIKWRDIVVDDTISNKLSIFYEELRNTELKEKSDNVQQYYNSMQSATKTRSARNRRVKALLSYLDYGI